MTAMKNLNVSEDKLQKLLIVTVRISLLFAMAIFVLLGEWEPFFISLLTFLLSGLPDIIEKKYSLRLPIEYSAVLIIFIYASLFLGSAGGAYEKYWWWDVLLHTTSGIVLAFSAYLVLFSLWSRGKLKTSPLIVSIFVFAFGLAAGAIWEIFEFTMDSVFGLNMQRSGLKDTMYDLIVDAAGSLVVARLAYSDIAGKTGLMRKIMNTFFRKNQRLWKKKASKKK